MKDLHPYILCESDILSQVFPLSQMDCVRMEDYINYFFRLFYIAN